MPSNPPDESSKAGSSRGARPPAPRWPAAIVWTLLTLCCALPVAWMVVALITTPAAWSALSPLDFHLRLLARTLAYNTAVAIAATALALPVAWVIGRGRGPLAAAITFVLPAALLLPSIVYAYGWMQVWRLTTGGVPMPGSLSDAARCIWTLATWLWPIPAGVIGLALRRMDGDLQQQALLDGGYWRITARQLIGPATAAMAIVTVLAMQEFAVYEPTGISVVATEVRTVFETGQAGSMTNPIDAVTSGQGAASFPKSDQRRNAAAALVIALPLLAVISLLSLWAVLLARRGEDETAAEEIGSAAWPRVLDARWPSKLLALTVIALTLLLPVAAMVISLKRPFDLGRVWRTFSPPVIGTFSIAVATAAIAVVLSLCGLIRRTSGAAILGLATFLIGGQMLAIALIRLYNHPTLPPGFRWVYNGPAVVIMAYLARFGWIALWAARSTWGGRWRQLREMAAVDGAGPVVAARFVIWPAIWPVVAAAGLLVMLLAMTEVPATVLLNPLRPQVFVPQLMTWVHTLRSDDMLEGSLLLAAIVAACATAIVALARLGQRRRAALRTAGKLTLIVAAVLLISGCKDAGLPDEVWLETGAGEGQVVYPRGICYDKTDDSFFVVDRLARIQHIDNNGKCLLAFRMPEWSQGKPTGLTVGPDGNLWVPDTHYGRVLVFNRQGQVINQFGKMGKGPGEFIYPCDIAFDAAGRVYVAEFGDNDRISVFSPDLKFLHQIGRMGDKDGEFSRPQSIVIQGDTIYVADSCNHRISVFTTDGRFLRNMGRIGSALGELRYPYGLDVDSKGRLVVCEFGNNRVQLIDKESGKGLASWGAAGRDLGQLAYPWAVAVDKRNRVVAVDAGNNRLQVFEF